MYSAIDRRIDHIATSLPILVSRLEALGYEFAHPCATLPGPEPNVEASIQRIETEVGKVPYAIAAFWRRVGSVDLCGSHPDWSGCDYPDPLVVDPASQAIAELEEFLADGEERMRCNFPYIIPVSADLYHKEDVSGGMWYNVECPALSDDPLINDERHHVTFLEYLELALRLGGFLGLDQCSRHSWPLQELAIDLSGIDS